MNHNGDSGESAFQAPRVAHISDEITQRHIIEAPRPHVMLLEFVPAEDHQPLGVMLLQHDLDKLFPEGTSPARNQNHLFRPIHSISPILAVLIDQAMVLFLVPWSSNHLIWR